MENLKTHISSLDGMVSRITSNRSRKHSQPGYFEESDWFSNTAQSDYTMTGLGILTSHKEHGCKRLFC
jgi:hypothetical protein